MKAQNKIYNHVLSFPCTIHKTAETTCEVCSAPTKILTSENFLRSFLFDSRFINEAH